LVTGTVLIARIEKDRPDAREFGDWTRKGPLPDISGQRRISDRVGYSSGPRGFDTVSEAGSDRSSRRPPYEQGDGKVRDFGNWDRKGPLTPTIPSGPTARNLDRPVSHDGPRDRRNSPAWGEGRSQDGSRPPRREFVERPVIDRAPTAPEMDNQWRAKMRPDPPAAPAMTPARSPALSSREISAPSSPAGAPQPLSVRPKLNLAKRTLTEAESSATSTSSVETKPSPFGAAKPIDTAAREKEVEEKRQVALREKKEAEDKAREEKRVAEEKSREEKRLAREAEKAENVDKASTPKEKSNGSGVEKENGIGAPSLPGKSYEILRRTAVEDSSVPQAEVEEEGVNGAVVEDKAVKPKEIVREISTKKVDGNGLTNGNSSPQIHVSPDSSAKNLEDDGWSTVSKPRNNRRNGNQAARAIAS
jgi:translation initiation factor 4B